MTSITVNGASSLKPGEMKKFQVSGTDILVANVDGTYYAIANTCTHMGGSLADGVLEGHTVRCPRHGAQYDVRTGKCIGELSMFFIKKKTGDVQSYPVHLIDNNISIDM